MNSNNKGRSVVCASILLVCVAALILAIVNRDHSLPEELVRSRRERLANLSQFEKEHLSSQQRRFNRLGEDAQGKLRGLQQDIENDPSAQRLQDVMSRYGKWLGGLPSSQRAELLSMPAEQRLEVVAKLVKQQQEARFAELLQVKLEKKDLEAILKWVDDFVANHDPWMKSNLDEVLQSLTSEQRARFHRGDDPQRCRRSLLIGAFLHPSHYESLPAEFPKPAENDFQDLRQQLSDRGKKLLDTASMGVERKSLVARWVRAAWSSKFFPDVPKDVLQKFYREEISDQRREYLERLSGERFQQTLKYFYYLHKREAEQQSAKPGSDSRGKSKGSKSKKESSTKDKDASRWRFTLTYRRI